jgi:hypothetical protein
VHTSLVVRDKEGNKRKNHIMKSIIQFKPAVPPLLITLALLCFGFLPKVQAVIPAPDGGYPGGGPNGSVRFELRELNTVSVDRNSFDGTYDQKFFDADGNVVFEDIGTLHGTRLSVDQFSNQPNATATK